MKKLKYFIVLIAFIMLYDISFCQTAEEQDMATIRQRMKGKLIEPYGESITISDILNKLNNDGSFKDIGSKPKAMTARIKTMAEEYYRGSSKYKGQESLRLKIYLALQYWLDNRPAWEWTASAFNWAEDVGAMALILYDDMQKDKSVSEERKKMVEKLEKSIIEFNHWCWKGNEDEKDEYPVTDDRHRGGNVGYRIHGLLSIAAFSNDANEMNRFGNLISRQFPTVLNAASYYPIGSTPDGTWHQHNGGGSQIYIAGYGRDWISNVLFSYSAYTFGTKWQLTEDEFNKLVDIIIDGFQWFYYNEQAVYTVLGRHSLRSNSGYGHSILNLDKKIRKLAGQHSYQIKREKELDKVIQRLSGNTSYFEDSIKYFQNSDMLIYGRKNSYMAIKMLSNRTAGNESGNGQGKLNYYLGDGSTFIFRKGNEYKNARVAWNFKAVPGITAEQNPKTVPLSDWGKNGRSDNDYAGGITDQKTALCSFDYNRKHFFANITAKKSYFTIDNKLIAIGSNINKKVKSPHEVWTTIEQNERQTEVAYNTDGTTKTIATTENIQTDFTQIAKTVWFHHNQTGYVIIPPEGEKVDIKLWAESRSGKWKNLDNTASEDDDVNVKIFQLSINHGTQPKNAKYSYIVIPNIAKESMDKYVKDIDFTIKNSEEAHLLGTKNGKYYASFFEEAEADFENIKIKSLQPTVCILKMGKQEHELYFADPTQKQNNGELWIDKDVKGDNINWNNITSWSEIKITFPTDMQKGTTTKKTFVYSEDPPPQIIKTIPSDNCTSAKVDTEFEIRLSENVKIDKTKKITIYDKNDEIFEQISLKDAVGDNYNYIIFESTKKLEHETEYYIKIESGAFIDLAGNEYTGISDKNSWNFKTSKPVEIEEKDNNFNIYCSSDKKLHINITQNISAPLKLEIYDLNGKLLMLKETIFTAEKVFNINMLKQGIYICKIKSGNKTMNSFKFLISD